MKIDLNFNLDKLTTEFITLEELTFIIEGISYIIPVRIRF